MQDRDDPDGIPHRDGEEHPGGGREMNRPYVKPPVVQLSKMFDAEPPHRLETEASLLGSMIIDYSCIGDVVEIITTSDMFWKPSHRLIFSAIVGLYSRNQPMDVVLLIDELQSMDNVDAIADTKNKAIDYIVMLAESVPSSASATYYAKSVASKYQERQILEAAGRAVHSVYKSNIPLEEKLDAIESDFFKIRSGSVVGSNQSETASSLMAKAYDAAANSEGVVPERIMSGYHELDEHLGGFRPGELIIIAGRPAMGKSVFGLNIAEYIGFTEGSKHVVSFHSLEMTKPELANRMLSSQARVPLSSIRRNMLGEQDWTDLQVALGRTADSKNIHVDDCGEISVMTFRAKARRLVRDHKVNIFVIDYLQLMSGTKSDSREQEVGSISRGLKAIAKELMVPIIVLAQLNRGPENRPNKRPRMSDLRESGSIEQDADVVLFMHRECYYHQGEEEGPPQNDTEAEVIIGKQRNGPMATVKLKFYGDICRFDNPEVTRYRRP